MDIESVDKINYKKKKHDGKTYSALGCNIEAAGW